jgi:hypothetical protein
VTGWLVLAIVGGMVVGAVGYFLVALWLYLRSAWLVRRW